MIILFTGQTRLRSMRFFGESTGPRCFFRSTPLPSFPRGERSTPPMHLTLGHLMRKTLRALRYHFSMMLYCIRKYREILFLCDVVGPEFLNLNTVLSFSKWHKMFIHLLSKPPRIKQFYMGVNFCILLSNLIFLQLFKIQIRRALNS